MRIIVSALAALALAGAAQAQELRAAPYAPACGDDRACAVWAAYRRERPFPYQAMAAAPAGEGALALILTEPAPALSRAELEALAREAFGPDLLAYAERRWMIGQDGWVEDAVLTLRWRPSQAAHVDPLDDRTMRARIAALHSALYGAAYGGDLEDARAPFAAPGAAPQLDPTPAELHAWLADPATLWRSVGARDAPASFAALRAQGASGAFIDDQNQLVIFIVPAAARADDAALAALRAPFRRFAVANDAVLGGAWNGTGDLVLIARARRAPLAAVAPLRFETFALLARERAGELQQSYQRDIPLSGKLLIGPQALRDWAPILLSPSLVDSEFGALLNITDQILKSWSEAGAVQYLYFDYPLRPEPGAFVFADRRLSRIAAEEMGAGGVLYNWNTAGAAAVMDFADMHVLAAGATGALPVTYGSELTAEPSGADHAPRLRALENEAYAYFAGRGDPLLARVVSYTLIYQLFRAAAAAPGAAPQAAPQRDAARAALRASMRALLDRIVDGAAAPVDPALASAVRQEAARLRRRLRAFAAAHPQYARDRDALAALLIKPNLAADARLRADARGLAAAIQSSAFMMHDLAAVNATFTAANAATPDGRIKTPSVVLSWDGADLMSALITVGGHNLAARALRIETDAAATRASLENTARGRVLRVPPAQAALAAANAHAIARLVEHEGAGLAEIEALLARAAAPPTRERRQVLGEAGADPDAFSGRLGDDR